jgi:glycosyl transferase family 25
MEHHADRRRNWGAQPTRGREPQAPEVTAPTGVPGPLPILIINLKARSDRLAAMTNQLAALGLTFETLPAVEAASLKSAAPAARSRLAFGDQACGMSHRRAWARALEGTGPYTAIFEDDVQFAPSARTLLSDTGWIPTGAKLIKLETFGRLRRTLAVGAPAPCTPPHAVRPFHSKNLGSAGYIIHRAVLPHLLARFDPHGMAVDHFLFNPDLSPAFEVLSPLLLAPSLCRQVMDSFGSDIHPTRQREPAYRRLERESRKLVGKIRTLARTAPGRLTGAITPLSNAALCDPHLL